MGKLQEMFDAQKSLQSRLGYDFNAMVPYALTGYIKEYSIHLNQEINEMLYELPFFKPWKDYSKMTDLEKADAMDRASKEYIDALHFFLNIGLALGFDEQTLAEWFFEKNAENHKRQDDGYTHDKSYRQEKT